MKHFFLLSSLCLALIFSSCDTSGTTSTISTDEDAVYLYTTNSSFPANFGGVSSANFYCADTYSSNSSAWDIDCNHTVAILADSTNSLASLASSAGLPEDLEFRTIDGALLGNNFTDFVDTRRNSMTGTGVAHSQVWTGFDTNGATVSFTCDDWTNPSAFAGNYAQITFSSSSDGTWHKTAGCGVSRGILCACWN